MRNKVLPERVEFQGVHYQPVRALPLCGAAELVKARVESGEIRDKRAVSKILTTTDIQLVTCPGCRSRIQAVASEWARMDEQADGEVEDDSLSQFPADECVRLTENVFIHHPKHAGAGNRIWFQVDVQYFQISVERSTLEAARWSAEQLIKALGKFKSNERGNS